jgi:H+-translocating NAD(P) transhydrogenase subunit alpha
MTEATVILYAIYIFMLAVFVGFEVISKVPVQLHTPLMSGTNAIHGIVMLGGMLVLAESGNNSLLTWLGFAAVVLGAMNLFGGFVVTDRMLEMFKTKKPAGGKS